MDNENGTATAAPPPPAVVTTKVEDAKPVIEITTTKRDATTVANTITPTIVEAVKSAKAVVANLDDKLVSTMDVAVKAADESTKSLNNSVASNDVSVNKTTTTVTVNVTQTKVTMDGNSGDVVDKGISEVVSSVSSIAEAAIEKAAEQELLKKTELKANNEAINSLEDVEMVEADVVEDCEMKDVSLNKQQLQAVVTTSNRELKNAEADSVNSSTLTAVVPETVNEAEQKKIDDVEKNISNLFNGDDNVVSTNDDNKTNDLVKVDNSSPVIASSKSKNDLLKNGTGSDSSSACKAQQSHDTIKDNNDLVSILAGSDRPEDNISSSSSINDTVTSKTVSSSENKPLKSVDSTTMKKTTQSIQKQLEVSADDEKGLGGKTSRQELISSLSSTTNEKSPGLLNSDVKNTNGLSDETDQVSTGSKKEFLMKPPLEKIAAKEESADSSSVTVAATETPNTPVVHKPEQSVFNVNICYKNSELIYFNVENAINNKTGSNSSTFISTSPSDQVSATTTTTDQQTAEKLRKEIKGTTELCTFIIEHFEKLRSKLIGNETPSSQKTPVTSGGRRGKNANASEPTTPSLTSTGSKRKRGAAPLAQESPATDSETQPKSAKKAKKEPTTPKTPVATESEYPEKAVLARWIDKKFYAGRVVEQKPNNKFVVLFEDGARKTLPEEHILFGKENSTLPLVNENVHALVSGDTYEPGTVQSVETRDDGSIYYTVLCESTTVTVTASDIYLEEDQAKIILSKQATNNPEPGFSGGSSTRKDRRNKRSESNRHVQWFSESDVSDINESDSRPASPVTVLEAVDGVQPELQHTQKESELVRICYLMERFGNEFRKINLDNVLGPIVTSNILKNKGFLLTCTIPIKTTTSTTTNGTNGTHERQNIRSNGHDFSNKNTIFTTVPFFKDYLKQQIEAAGGTVYSNFENIPTNRYRTCYLLAPFPCITAKYVQCLAANIMAVSHEWIVDSCQRNKLLNKDDYVLPSGWSIIEAKYKPWSIGRGRDQRKNAFAKTTIILTSQQSDFVEFWSRVCKSAGAKIRLVKSINDLTATTKGYILLDDEFPLEYQSRAERFHIPIVSTVWVIQSLILGKVCDPNAHPKLTQLYEDDYF